MKILSDQSNLAVVQLESRNFPGSVIQGDSLYSLYIDSLDVLEELSATPHKDAFHAALSVCERLEDRLAHYIETCSAQGIEWHWELPVGVKKYEHLIEDDT